MLARIPGFARRSAVIAAALSSLTAASAPAAHAAQTSCQLNLPPTTFVEITGTVGDVVVDSACQFVYATNTDHNRVEVISLETATLQSPIQVGSKPVGLDISPDGQALYVANSGGNNISVVDLVHRVELREITVPAGFSNDTPYWIAIASNGLALFSTTFAGSGFGGHLDQLVLATDAVSVRTDFWFGGTTTELTRLTASRDRSVIGIVAGDISSGPVFKYSTATDTFSPEKDLNLFTSAVSLDATGSTLLVTPGTFVLDGSLNLAGTIPPMTGGGAATSPDGTVGYRPVGATVEFLDLTAFAVIESRKLLDTTDTAAIFNTIGLMDLSDDGSLLAIITDHGVSLVSTGPPVSLVLPAVTLNFGVVRAGSTVQYVTPGQDLTMSQTGGSGTVDWIALRDVPWLSTSPTFGTGPGLITFSVNSSAASLVSGTYIGHIWIYTDGTVDPALVPGPLTVTSAGTARAPVGVVDTPINGLSGVAGSMAVTGWAIDDVGVKQVRILRAPATGEGTKPIFLGIADLVDGARPDVAALYPTRPFNTRAGWGFMILTNMLPRQGNGSYTLYAYADDFDGHSTLLGSRTITCDNLHSILPFGAIDTPSQGGTASGSPFVNFGWVLAGQPGRYIPFDGHTIEAFIDSVSIGTLDTYNNARSDIQHLFPGYANTNGAVGAKFFDTAPMANGLHTLAWVARDDVGHAQGIGSRFFKVFNQSGLYLDDPAPAVAQPATMSAGRAAARPSTARMPFAGTLVLTRGWSATAQPQFLAPEQNGVYTTTVTVGDRIVLNLNPTGEPARYAGRRLNGGTSQNLPIGSSLDAEGYFTWAPAPGFGGVHEFVFRVERDGASSEIRVRVAVRARITAGASR